MDEKIKAFLMIEKLTTGKVENFKMWDEIPLSHNAVTIGRPSREPGYVLPDIKILRDDYISRGDHAEIFFDYDRGCYMLRDERSRNHTFLNGQMLEKHTPYALKERDEIGLAKIGGEMRVIFRFKLGEQTQVGNEPAQSIPKEGLYIDEQRQRVFAEGKQVSLTKTEHNLLFYLNQNRNIPCSIDDIAHNLGWEADIYPDQLVAQYVRRLRMKIERDPSTPQFIITEPGRRSCYRLELA